MTEASTNSGAGNRPDGALQDRPGRHFHLVGGVIASLATAFLINVGDISAYSDTIFKESDQMGLKRGPPLAHKGKFDPRARCETLHLLHDLDA